MSELVEKKISYSSDFIDISKIQKKIDAHNYNSYIISIIYIFTSVIALVFSTVVSLMLGSKSIQNAKDNFTIVMFVLNLISTIIVSVVNFLKLESKIKEHESTVQQYESLLFDIESGLEKNVILEKEKMINNYSPNMCF